MMGETLELVRQVRERYEAIEAENRRLSAELTDTRKELAKAQIQVDTLKAKYDRLKLARAYGWNEEQKHVATDRITKLVREIDSCLSLLKKMN